MVKIVKIFLTVCACTLGAFSPAIMEVREANAEAQIYVTKGLLGAPDAKKPPLFSERLPARIRVLNARLRVAKRGSREAVRLQSEIGQLRRQVFKAVVGQKILSAGVVSSVDKAVD